MQIEGSHVFVMHLLKLGVDENKVRTCTFHLVSCLYSVHSLGRPAIGDFFFWFIQQLVKAQLIILVVSISPEREHFGVVIFIVAKAQSAQQKDILMYER